MRELFPYKLLLTEEGLLQRIKDGNLFGYLQCDIEGPEHLRENFAKFPPIFKNTNVSRDDIGPLMKYYAEKNQFLTQPRRMLISSFHLKNGTLITPLFLFFLQQGLVCTKIYRFGEYTPLSCFNSFVQSAVNARREGDKNPNSTVVAETMKLLANSSYGYQILDRSRHTVTKYLSDEKTHSAINNKMFKRLNHINDNLYEVEMAKAEVEHKEPIIVGFFILQYAKLRMLELFYYFFYEFCENDKYDEMEMDTDSLYLALAETNLYDCIKEDKKEVWEFLRSEDCNDNFVADTSGIFSHARAVKSPRNTTRENRSFQVGVPVHRNVVSL